MDDGRQYRRQTKIAFWLSTTYFVASCIVMILSGQVKVRTGIGVGACAILSVVLWLYVAPWLAPKVPVIARSSGKALIHPWTRHLLSYFVVVLVLARVGILEWQIGVLVFCAYALTLPPRQSLK